MKLQEIDRADYPATVRDTVGDPDRLAVLESLGALIEGGDPDFDRIVELATTILDAPIAMVTLLDDQWQFPKARRGIDLPKMKVESSFCAHTIAFDPGAAMVVENALDDVRFASNPNVTGGIGIRFYAGAPIVVHGKAIGAVCVLDTKPRPCPAPRDIAGLTGLADLASSLFAFKHGSRRAAASDAALARAEERHALALKAASIASWVWDIRAEMVECDALMPRLLDLSAGTRFPTTAVMRSIDPRDIPSIERGLEAALSTGDEYAGEFRVAGIDPPRWLSGRGKVVERDARGRPSLVFGVVFDISEGRLGQERQRLLLRELNHRVKNTLATVQALATQTVRHSAEPRAFLDAFGGRLQSLGLAHSLLSDQEWRGISLKQLIMMQVMPLASDGGDRIVVDGEDTHISPDQAVALGMILHELATNAVKYGALSVGRGHVDLAWSLSRDEEGARWIKLRWQEVGGPKVSPPDRRGFGSILIERSLGKVLSSTVEHEFAPSGVVARITTPLQD